MQEPLALLAQADVFPVTGLGWILIAQVMDMDPSHVDAWDDEASGGTLSAGDVLFCD